jgi:tyrosyl-tRNA synthetase
VTDSAAARQASRLTEGAVEALPEGRLAEQLAAGRGLRVKLGIDPTAPDIHLGHVVVLDELRAFQDAGHVVVLIIGDYTARVGDPSGRVAERPMLTAEQIAANSQTFQDQAFEVLDPERTEVRRNSEWLAMGSDELFGLVRRFTVARLLEREEFSRRMEAGEPISILELLYPVLQGYDSVAVEADVEVGGTDQLGTDRLLEVRDSGVSVSVDSAVQRHAGIAFGPQLTLDAGFGDPPRPEQQAIRLEDDLAARSRPTCHDRNTLTKRCTRCR